MHHQASRTLLSTLDASPSGVTSLINSVALTKYTPNHSIIGDALSSGSTLNLDDTTALEFFVAQFIWGDIISSATFGAGLYLASSFKYLHLLTSNKIQLSKLTAQNWTMIIIMEIALLQEWKQEAQQRGALSLQELTWQAARLEQRLNDGMVQLLRHRTSLKGMAANNNLITEIYALAALVFLQVVVSGAQAELPEINRCVTRFLEALNRLPSRLTLRISWPFCIAGCMAIGSQQDEFREFVSRALRDGEILGTIWKGFKVMEECWRIRVTQPKLARECDWRTGMESLGVRILLA